MTIKKIDVSQLQPGMFVANFKTDWREHPFYLRRLFIEDAEQIRLVAGSGIQEVFIDTSLGRDVTAPARRTPTAEEFGQARRLLEDASSLIRHAINDIRMGRTTDIEAVQQIATDVADSVLRNRDLMMLLCSMYHRQRDIFAHSVNVCVLLINFACQQGLPGDRIKAIAVGGLLHDVGMDPKDGELSVDKDHAHHVEDRGHVIKALTQLSPYDLPAETLAVISEHHERADGSGYPQRLKAEKITVYGAMAAIADTYDYLCSASAPGQAATLPSVAMAKLFEWSPRYFDPTLSTGFVRAVGIYPVGSLVRLASGLLAVVTQHRPNDLLHPKVRIVYDTTLPAPVCAQDRDLADLPWSEIEHIVGPEDPAKWGIAIEDYLSLNTRQ